MPIPQFPYSFILIAVPLSALAAACGSSVVQETESPLTAQKPIAARKMFARVSQSRNLCEIGTVHWRGLECKARDGGYELVCGYGG